MLKGAFRSRRLPYAILPELSNQYLDMLVMQICIGTCIVLRLILRGTTSLTDIANMLLFYSCPSWYQIVITDVKRCISEQTATLRDIARTFQPISRYASHANLYWHLHCITSDTPWDNELNRHCKYVILSD